MNIRFKHFLVALGLFVILFLLVFFSFGIPVLGSKPVIQNLDPVMARPGEKILVRGSGFGHLKHRSRVFVAGQPLSSSSIGNWSDREIETSNNRVVGQLLSACPSFEGMLERAAFLETLLIIGI